MVLLLNEFDFQESMFVIFKKRQETRPKSELRPATNGRAKTCRLRAADGVNTRHAE